MNKSDVLSERGNPGAKWIGVNGVECWQYRTAKSLIDREKGGNWFVVFQNDQVLKVVTQGRNFYSLVVGLPEAAAVEILGEPHTVSANKNTKFLLYKVDLNKYQYRVDYVRIENGMVESFGEKGDFDTTKDPTSNININIDDKRK